MSEHETPAETIRRAIEEMRADAGLIPSNDTWEPPSALAAADLLKAVYATYPRPGLSATIPGVHAAAEHLARTYLGETP